ncbi:hypothetical protein HJG60_011635 [Phyllostomus discolor]|uniref:Uncharacterized protein n=1 Tax=Phyllostomus discolor TaxID=89673 RepID=A0A834E0Y3_9CHIR|nr:hypothetical protein HJG60_011635 [Phyllostomus discolor]
MGKSQRQCKSLCGCGPLAVPQVCWCWLRREACALLGRGSQGHSWKVDDLAGGVLARGPSVCWWGHAPVCPPCSTSHDGGPSGPWWTLRTVAGTGGHGVFVCGGQSWPASAACPSPEGRQLQAFLESPDRWGRRARCLPLELVSVVRPCRRAEELHRLFCVGGSLLPALLTQWFAYISMDFWILIFICLKI